jgi:hypothetical protein
MSIVLPLADQRISGFEDRLEVTINGPARDLTLLDQFVDRRSIAGLENSDEIMQACGLAVLFRGPPRFTRHVRGSCFEKVQKRSSLITASAALVPAMGQAPSLKLGTVVVGFFYTQNTVQQNRKKA